MKQETVTPCVLIFIGAAICLCGLWDFWTADLAETAVMVSLGCLMAALGVVELNWTREFNEQFDGE
jgi:hypothetical protein